MIEELKRLIMDSYAIPRKTIDEDFYKKICLIMLKNMELSKELGNISFESYYTRNGVCDPGVMEAYESAQNLIHIYVDAIKQQCDDALKKCPKDFSEEEREYLRYIIVAQATMHEMTHVQQEKFDKIESLDGKKPRTKILHKSDLFSLDNIAYIAEKCNEDEEAFRRELGSAQEKTNSFLMGQYGCSIIKERDAQNQSFLMLDSILSKYGDAFPHLRKYVKLNRDCANLMGYKVKNNSIESPAYNVMKFMLENGLSSSENLEWMGNNPNVALQNSLRMFPDMSNRASLGLPITPSEHAELAKRCNQAIDDGYIWKMYRESPYDGEDIGI